MRDLCDDMYLVISIHALLAESDIELAFLAINPITFLSTLSLRRATPGAKSTTPERYYFYPRSPCGERHIRVLDGSKSSIISIHALLAESDPGKVKVVEPGFVFLSTLSLRRATGCLCSQDRDDRDFYPRSPCGERHLCLPVAYDIEYISIHALLAESDQPALSSKNLL